MLPGHNKNYVFLIFIELMTINSPVPLLFNFYFSLRSVWKEVLILVLWL